jgi:hypothetical protein
MKILRWRSWYYLLIALVAAIALVIGIPRNSYVGLFIHGDCSLWHANAGAKCSMAPFRFPDWRRPAF